MALHNTFETTVFNNQLRSIDLPGARESIVGGQARDFGGIAKAFSGITTLVVMGYSSQGSAQAQNLRDTFVAEGIDCAVKVALRAESPNRVRAEQDGFTEANGTLVTPEQGLPTAQMVLMLISDKALAQHGEQYLELLPANAIVCLAHGFYVGYLEAVGGTIAPDLTVIGVCPKGLGPSVRKLYQQGGGINASFAVHQFPPGGQARATELAIGVVRAIGAPYVFQTTLANEWRSDIFGERAILDAGIHALAEVIYDWKIARGSDPETAYLESVESLVGPISDTIAADGLYALYKQLDAADKATFETAYNAAYPVLHSLMVKIYRDVSSGREILEVVEDGLYHDPMLDVGATDLWQFAGTMRAKLASQPERYSRIDAVTAGMYAAGVIAQVDVLLAQGHAWSEIINETILEAVESLFPYMRAEGISSMIDNCSVTARRGDRKWAPIIASRCKLGIMPVIDGHAAAAGTDFADFRNHKVHAALQTFAQFRSPVTIVV